MFSKKKGFQKSFSSNLKKKVFKNFFQAKKVFKNFFFRRFPLEENKKGLRKFSARFLALSNKISTLRKIMLSSSRGQGNFRGLEASRPGPRTLKCVLEAKGVLEGSTTGYNPKKFLETLNLFTQPEFSGKKRDQTILTFSNIT